MDWRWNILKPIKFSYYGPTFLVSFTANIFNVYPPSIFSQCDLRIPQAKKTFQANLSCLFVLLRQSLVHNFQNSSYILTRYVPILSMYLLQIGYQELRMHFKICLSFMQVPRSVSKNPGNLDQYNCLINLFFSFLLLKVLVH